MSSKKSYFIVSAIAISMFGSVIGFNEYKNTKIKEFIENRPEASMPIVSAIIKYDSYSPEIRTIGFIAPDKGVNVNNELTGTIENIYFNSGDYVNKGDVLLKLDTAYEEAQIKSLKAKIPATKSKYERYGDLIKKGSISRESYDEAEANYLSMLGDLDTIETKVEQKTIKAPFSGFTGLRNVQLGEFLSTGSTIVRLENLNLMKLKIAVSQKYFHEIKEKQKVKINVSSKEKITYEGYILAISPVVNPSTGLFNIEVAIPNENKELRSGMYAKVAIELAKENNQIIVPQTSIQYALYGESLYVVEKSKDGKERAKQVFVKTGHRINDNVIIEDGVKLGDKIVTNGQLRLSNGVLVHEVKDDSLKNSKIINRL